MRDPRLLEIDFLMDLEQAGTLEVRSTSTTDTTGVATRDGELQSYGAPPRVFRDLMVHLVLTRLVGGNAVQTSGGSGIREEALVNERLQMLKQITSGQPQDLRITHAGRVRLWDLRDALLRDPDLEPFGLRSRAAWERDLPIRLRWASSSEPLSLVFVDLDDFGIVNKQFGATVGDDVLRATFTLTQNLVGARGVVYRYGGEELGILLPATTLAAAERIGEELRSMIESEVVRRVSDLGRAQTASIGVSVFASYVEPRSAVERADAAMREAKQAGKNRVVTRTA